MHQDDIIEFVLQSTFIVNKKRDIMKMCYSIEKSIQEYFVKNP